MVGCGRKIGPYDCCTVVCGDCQELMKAVPPDSVDGIVTDPPYGMGWKTYSGAYIPVPEGSSGPGWKEYKGRKIFDSIIGDSELPTDAIRLAISLARNYAYVFMRWDNIPELYKADLVPKSVVVWVKTHGTMGDLTHEHQKTYEMAAFYPKIEDIRTGKNCANCIPQRHMFTKRPSDVLGPIASPGNVIHPSQKPVELISRLIEANVGETILDPYSGSGTTAAACKLLGKHFLAFEIHQGFVDESRNRILSAGVRPTRASDIPIDPFSL